MLVSCAAVDLGAAAAGLQPQTAAELVLRSSSAAPLIQSRGQQRPGTEDDHHPQHRPASQHQPGVWHTLECFTAPLNPFNHILPRKYT